MKSCHELSAAAADYRFNPRVPAKLYLKTCVSLLEEAQGSFQSGQLERAYVMYLRYLDLCTKKLPTHPQLSARATGVDLDGLAKEEYLQLLKLEVPAILRITEDLRTQLERSFAQHARTLARNVAGPRPAAKDKAEKVELPTTFDENRFRSSVAKLQSHGGGSAGGDGNAGLAQRSSALTYPELPQLNLPSYASF